VNSALVRLKSGKDSLQVSSTDGPMRRIPLLRSVPDHNTLKMFCLGLKKKLEMISFSLPRHVIPFTLFLSIYFCLCFTVFDFFSFFLAAPFPRNFLSSVKTIFTRLFRCFAIIYCHHYTKLDQVAGTPHLNTSFKHFLYYVWEFDLVAQNELDALKEIIQEIKPRESVQIRK
jgi:hypothetical protein